MRRRALVRISLAGAVLALLCSAAAAGQDRGSEGMVADTERAEPDRVARAITVRVVGTSCLGATGGSGFVVDGVLHTSRHLVEAAPTLAVSDGSTDWVLAVVEAEGRDVDVATAVVATGPALAPEPAQLAATDPEIGAEVVMAGWVDGSLLVRRARVHLYVDGAAYGTGRTVMLLEPATTYGFSGGPVLDADGAVVGILSAVDLATGLTVAVPVSEVHDWRQNGKRQTAPTSC